MPGKMPYSALRTAAILLMLAALAVLAATYIAFPRAYMLIIGAGSEDELTAALYNVEMIYCYAKRDGAWRDPFLVKGQLYSAVYWRDRLLLFFQDGSLTAFDRGQPRERRELTLGWPVEAAVPAGDCLYVFGTVVHEGDAGEESESIAAARIQPLGTPESPEPVQEGMQVLLAVPDTPWNFTAAPMADGRVVLAWSRAEPFKTTLGVDFAVFDGTEWSEPMPTPLPRTDYPYFYRACAVGEDVWLFDSASLPAEESSVGYVRLSAAGASDRAEHPLGMKLAAGFPLEAISDGDLAHIFFVHRQKLYECTFDGTDWTKPVEIVRTQSLPRSVAVLALVVLGLLAVFIVATGVRMLNVRMRVPRHPPGGMAGDGDET